MTTAEGWQKVEAWITDQQDTATRQAKLDPDLDLFETGILTSLQVIELLVVIERSGGEKVDRMQIQPDDFRTLRAVQSKFFPGLVPQESP
jgi:acyl carrier protein